MFSNLTCSSIHRQWLSRETEVVAALQFLTNVFMVPYMALRERIPRSEQAKAPKIHPKKLPSFSKLFGGVSFFIAIVSLFWVFQGRPDFGGFDARLQFAVEQFNGNRAFWAFVLDLGLYSVWQAILMADCGAPSKYRYVPFFGLAAWLIADGPSLQKGLSSGFWDSQP